MHLILMLGFFLNVVVADAFRAAQNVGFKIAQAFGQFNIEINLNSIKSSVFILHGEEDQILPLKGSQDLAAQIAGAGCEILMGKGHCPNLEDPPLFGIRQWNFFFLIKLKVFEAAEKASRNFLHITQKILTIITAFYCSAFSFFLLIKTYCNRVF